ncbi:uncharacterized protein [Choristoneura fumiferana]|uniref:uncharacterized protein n=1 Tax=Choristoneura fumiferana TaxID=7141 RepID=UPI003D15E8DC
MHLTGDQLSRAVTSLKHSCKTHIQQLTLHNSSLESSIRPDLGTSVRLQLPNLCTAYKPLYGLQPSYGLQAPYDYSFLRSARLQLSKLRSATALTAQAAPLRPNLTLSPDGLNFRSTAHPSWLVQDPDRSGVEHLSRLLVLPP